ncbi:hypothetical protein B5T_04323 [Alloalcanivorax dieselolei B5]|uniref:Transmembrane protein n=1 Tax=Alcanivorax dieselolei (strain DSM 16502 / CGMCC 1.3690 / MCCC 1A00001 / B-5) TaxID=930169 RepID=K0CIV9_ALCDB|nr:hypothetical protein [Alloalcanivorax dieselolei]AFT72583.1 hypothetical protein B5T_04323 [Alloalcanivorax dieselolei B5]GGJ78943.1 hypothetical protein GCM10007426_05070 [Alloalcanivorax dieselolei]
MSNQTVSEQTRALARRLTLVWFAVLSAPLLVGVAIALLVAYGHFQPLAELVPADTARMVAVGAMGLVLVVARPLRKVLLAPQTVAARPLKDPRATSAEGQELAALKAQAGAFSFLGVMDLVSVLVIVLSLAHADAVLALINGVFSLILALVAKPDFAALINDVATELRRPS